MKRNWERLAAALAKQAPIVNLTGPLGAGKTYLLGQVRDSYPGIDLVDNVDSSAAIADAAARVRAGTRLIIASRRSVASHPQWTEQVVTVEVRPWSSTEIAVLAGGSGLAQQLSGGLPLIASHIARLAHDAVDAPTAVAAVIAGDILRRLGREGAGAGLHGAITALAIAGSADEEMLGRLGAVAPEQFNVLAGLSITRREATGLTMLEPFRTLFDLAASWRLPLQRRTLQTTALAHRARQIATVTDSRRLSQLVDRTLMALDDPAVRETLYPAAEPAITVRAATSADYAEAARLTRLWAARGGLQQQASERMLNRWWDLDPAGCRLAVDESGLVHGMYYLLPVSAQASGALESLLQQHSAALAESSSGQLLGMAFAEEGAHGVHGVLLRHALVTGVTSGRLLVSTPWLPYQHLALKVGLIPHGHTRDDLYRCGRPNGVFARTFSPSTALAWLHSVSQVLSGEPTSGQRWDTSVRHALKHLRQPGELSRNPLVAQPAIGSAGHLAAIITHTIERLAASTKPDDAEAGQVLACRYLDGLSHDSCLRRASLSRATYFRRLRYGVSRITEILQSLGKPLP